MKGIKQAFDRITSKVQNQIKGCVQCDNNDCKKCNGNQHSFDYVFGNDQRTLNLDCFYFAEYYSAPDVNFDNWTINGNSFNNEISLITGNASNSINPNAYPIIYDLRFAWKKTNDISLLPTLPEAKDSFGNSFYANWVQAGCELKCWELIVPQRDVTFGAIHLGISISSFIDYQGFGFGVIDISNPVIVSAIDSYYKSAFGNQSSVVVFLDANNDYVIQINNTYENFNPFWSNFSLGDMFFNEITC